LPNIKDEIRQSAKLWRVNCQGTNAGAIVAAEDEKGRLINSLYYGPNWTYLNQWVVKYELPMSPASPEQISVELWKAPNDFVGRTIYVYDQRHNLTEIRKLDYQEKPVVIANVERKQAGGFYQIVLQFFDGSGLMRSLYQPDDPQLAKIFYLCEVFGKIPKQVESLTNAIPASAANPFAPDLSRSGSLPDRTATTSPFSVPASPDGALHVPAVAPGFFHQDPSTAPGSAPSSDHLKQSPFESKSNDHAPATSTPGLDALRRQLKQAQ
jgi:hypothetical protein